ncbi:hypothetical protein R0H17_25105 [Phytobacter diazotrophicus]|uniref:hypothetical protein n=1 Tax=Phytobacter diazotrophicus TaxID=395631 RepID=UPI00293604A3|nr:hypothetical protein [Phytobacter diazotrophicus]MDV2904903.1 hypothetical protein [Phytobacter diazotrophicus]
MSGLQIYNSAGVLTIDGSSKSVVASQYKAMGAVSDVGYYQLINSLGGQYTTGYLAQSFFPSSGLRWFRPLVDGSLNFPGALMYQPGSGDFMITSNTNGIASGYCDVFNESGALIWSAVAASSMPRIIGFLTVPAGYNLSSPITLSSPIANPFICVSQCPGNLSDDGSVTGYSGIMIRRDNASTFTLQYINKNQNNFSTAMGNNGFNIALAYFVGY